MSANNGYRTLSELYSSFQALPNVTQEIIGTTYNGANIFAFHFGNRYGGHVMIEGCIHGLECLNSELLYQYALWLTGGSAEANRILQYNWTTIIPSFNVDNYLKNRKNAHIYSKVINGTTYSGGVDLNRNFQAGWVRGSEDPTVACSSTTGSQVPSCYNHQGPNALSEPEPNVMRAFISKYKPKWFVDMHTGEANSYLYYQCNPTDLLSVQTLMATLKVQFPEVIPQNVSGTNKSMCYNDARAITQNKSVLWEIHPTEDNLHNGPPASNIPTLTLPKFKRFAQLISADVEVTTPPPPPNILPIIVIAIGIVLGIYLLR